MTLVALLRGINVGGKHRVPMAELRRIVTEAGGADVSTYINSGNVVFEHGGAGPGSETDRTALGGELEAAIQDQMGVSCRVLVLAGAEISRISAVLPEDWTNGPDVKTDVLYLLDGVSASEAATVLRPREGIDHTLAVDGALIWMTSRADASRSGLQRLVGSDLYRRTTIRNANTARKLAAMVAERSA